MTLQGQQNWGGALPRPIILLWGVPPNDRTDPKSTLTQEHARVISSLHFFTALVMRLTSIPETK